MSVMMPEAGGEVIDGVTYTATACDGVERTTRDSSEANEFRCGERRCSRMIVLVGVVGR